MIGLIDPAFFLQRGGRDAVHEAQQDIDLVIATCKQHGIRLPKLTEYWPELWRTLGQQLEQSLTPNARRSLQALRNLGAPPPTPSNDPSGTIWTRGFDQLFGLSALGNEWRNRMMKAAVRAASSGEEVIFLSRRIPGRNMQIHEHLEENTRWILHVRIGTEHKKIWCYYHPRNAHVLWTIRYDWRLPVVGRFRFEPLEAWQNPSTTIFKTCQSKSAWLDKRGHGWARPSIRQGQGNHWDVYLEGTTQIEATGVDQINVRAYGVAGREGELEHVPDKKRTRVKDSGWVS